MPLDNGQFELRIVALEAEIKRLRDELELTKARQAAPYVYSFPPMYVQQYIPWQQPYLSWSASGTGGGTLG